MSTGSSIGVIPEGQTGPQMTVVVAADAAHLPLLAVPTVRGRGFDPSDNAQSHRVAIVNRAFARKHWPDEDPIGRRITIVDSHEVVGVVEDVVELTDGTSRMRLGLVASAQPTVSIQRLVFRQTAIPLGVGAAAGLFAAIQSTKVLAALLFEVAPTDPHALAIAAATMLVVGLVAAWQPARAAAAVDPMVALRAE
jgi:hypothetical protein